MPSELIVSVCKIDQVLPHPNADKLEVGVIKGWNVVIPKDQLHAGDMIVYFPPDTLVPEALGASLGVNKYINPKNGFGRVRAIKLRGHASHGFSAKVDDVKAYLPTIEFKEDENIAEKLGCKKWEPEEPKQPGPKGGKTVKSSPLLTKYTDIQNFRHHPSVFEEDELVVVTEKIHGSNLRSALLFNESKRWWKPWTWLQKTYVLSCGSNNVQRSIDEGGIYNIAIKDPKMVAMLRYIWEKKDPKKNIIVYGEVFGSNIQDLKYGRAEPDYVIFDISVDDVYQDWSYLRSMCTMFNIPTVPELYRGKFNMDKIKSLVSGNTFLMDKDAHMREGIVIKPEKEGVWNNGRKILKYVSDEYLTRKDGTENH